MSDPDPISGLLLAAVIIAAVLLVLAWVLLPVAVFGLKSLLRDLLFEQRRTNEALATLLDLQRRQAPPAPRPLPPPGPTTVTRPQRD